MLPGGDPDLFPENCDDVSHWKSSGLIASLAYSPSREVCWNKVSSKGFPLLKSSLNSENCQEYLFKEPTLGAEDKSIYLHVKTTQCLCWSPNTRVARSLGWRCWNARSPGRGVYPTETQHSSNQLCGVSIFPPSPATLVSLGKIRSPGH